MRRNEYCIWASYCPTILRKNWALFTLDVPKKGCLLLHQNSTNLDWVQIFLFYTFNKIPTSDEIFSTWIHKKISDVRLSEFSNTSAAIWKSNSTSNSRIELSNALTRFNVFFTLVQYKMCFTSSYSVWSKHIHVLLYYYSESHVKSCKRTRQYGLAVLHRCRSAGEFTEKREMERVSPTLVKQPVNRTMITVARNEWIINH